MANKVKWLIGAKTINNENIVQNIDDINQPLPKYNENENGYNWIHLSAKCLKTKQWLNKQLEIDQVWINALIASESRPRFVKINHNSFFINLRGINFIDNDESEDMISLRLYITKNMIISTQIYQLKAITHLKNEINNNEPPLTSAHFLSKVIDFINADIEEAIFTINDEIDDLEEMSLTEHDKDFRQSLIVIRRQMIIFRRYLSPNSDALKGLCTMASFYHPNSELYDHLIESENKLVFLPLASQASQAS